MSKNELQAQRYYFIKASNEETALFFEGTCYIRCARDKASAKDARTKVSNRVIPSQAD